MALSLDDVMAAPTDPDLLRRHLMNLGVLTPPIVPPSDNVAPMTPPNLAPTNVPIPFRRPETPETPYPKDSFTRPHLPAMKSSEMPEAPVMSTPAVPTNPMAVAPMTPPVLSPEQQQQLPMTSPGSPTLGVPFYEKRLEEALAKEHPDKMSDHPSFLGKVGHVLGRVGNVVGEALVPGALERIPGTDIYNREAVQRAEGNLAAAQKGESEEELKKAQGREAASRGDFAEAEARKLGQAGKIGLQQDANGNLVGWTDPEGNLHAINEDATPPAIKEIAKNWEGKAAKAGGHENLEQGLAGAVSDAIAKGGNPATDPAVKAWGDALQQYKPSKTADVKTAEDLKQRIAVAVEKGDAAEVARLQKELEATDPEGMARLRESQMRAAESAENIRASRADREEKQGLEWVTGETADGKTVMVPLSQAKSMGLKNQAKADADHINKTLSARVVVPMLFNSDPADPGVIQLVDQLDKQGKLGPLASRWNDFMARGWGSGDPLYTALRTRLDLAQTKMMQAHVGSRGGSYMLEHFENLANAGKLDAKNLRSALDQELRYMSNNAQNPGRGAASSGGTKAPKAGDVVGGYKFKGGDPNDQNNYEKVTKK